jgi:large subunit ribosomal protein L32
LSVGALVLCAHCRKPHLSHHVCPNCGYYNGREVIAPEPARSSA